MKRPKFNVGDECEVIEYTNGGSQKGDNFIISKINKHQDIERYRIYHSTTGGITYEYCLKLKKVTNWKKFLEEKQ